MLGLPLSLEILKNDSEKVQPGKIYIDPVDLEYFANPGELDLRSTSYVLKVLKKSVKGCLSGKYSGMVTAPVHKETINKSGIKFIGHTEYLAELSGGDPVMMLANPKLRVALATTHLPLKDVSSSITVHLLNKVITIINSELKEKFGIEQPKIFVCSLNPHAGEGGYLGNEEKKIIEPVLNALQSQGIKVSGPFPADTVFTKKYIIGSDVILAMYHDQGLPVLKHSGFGFSANITLGLPIIRTSVDHGTALSLAGSGETNEGSLCSAIEQAIVMAGV